MCVCVCLTDFSPMCVWFARKKKAGCQERERSSTQLWHPNTSAWTGRFASTHSLTCNRLRSPKNPTSLNNLNHVCHFISKYFQLSSQSGRRPITKPHGDDPRPSAAVLVSGLQTSSKCASSINKSWEFQNYKKSNGKVMVWGPVVWVGGLGPGGLGF